MGTPEVWSHSYPHTDCHIQCKDVIKLQKDPAYSFLDKNRNVIFFSLLSIIYHFIFINLYYWFDLLPIKKYFNK